MFPCLIKLLQLEIKDCVSVAVCCVSDEEDVLFMCKLDICACKFEFSCIKVLINESQESILSLRTSILFNLIPIIIQQLIAICSFINKGRFTGVNSSIDFIMKILFCRIMG